MPSWQEFIYGTPGSTYQAPLYSTQTQETLNKILNMGLERANTPAVSFDPIAEQARKDFVQKTLPSIYEGFERSAGSSSGGSGLAAMLSGAGRGLERDLAANKALFDANQRNQDQRFSADLLRLGLTPAFQNIYTPPQPGLAHAAAPAVGQAIGQFAPFTTAGASIGSSLGGPIGGAIGGGLGALGDIGKYVWDYLSSKKASPSVNTIPTQSSPLASDANAYSQSQLLNQPVTYKGLIDILSGKFSGGNK